MTVEVVGTPHSFTLSNIQISSRAAEKQPIKKVSRDGLKPLYVFDQLPELRRHFVDASGQAPSWDTIRGILGGKGANLFEMTRLGIPVPPGFTITTLTCLDYLKQGKLRDAVWNETLSAMHKLEERMERKFGEGLLVSCRSGAKFSMPGMMDTVLNIGLNDDIVQKIIDQKQMDPKLAWNLYRRLMQMFGSVVLDLPDEKFENVIERRLQETGLEKEIEFGEDDWKWICIEFKKITGRKFPSDVYMQLKMAVESVFKSWNGKRAIDYRNAVGIDHSLGTAVNVQVMVFGNRGKMSATGVAMSRDSTTGVNQLEGDMLINAQGEDVVAGIRATEPLSNLEKTMPENYKEFKTIANKLEEHFREMQDMEFTIEEGKLWILQTRDGKRSAQAAVRIAVEMVNEGLISKEEAIRRVSPKQVEHFLHPQLNVKEAKGVRKLARGLNVSPGAGVGRMALDADVAVRWEKSHPVIMVRNETKPDDVHGMIAAEGIVTSRGGRTSHASLVARQFGKPAVVGVEAMKINMDAREVRVDDVTIQEGEWLSIDGTEGVVYQGKLKTLPPDFTNEHLITLLKWADDVRDLGVMANSDSAPDAERARKYGAEGIGLCRTEHMFFEKGRLEIFQNVIMAKHKEERDEGIKQLLSLQRSDFEKLFSAMRGCPIVIRTLDPPLSEFVPAYDLLANQLSELKLRLQHLDNGKDIDEVIAEIRAKQDLLERAEALKEQNPMLGMRGVRLGLLQQDLCRMQVRAMIEAAIECTREGHEVNLEIMVPLVAHVNELAIERRVIEEEAKQVLKEQNDGKMIPFKVGTMLEVPRAALTADEIATQADFFSFGSNDLTQCTFAMSRDDAETTFLVDYLRQGILKENPFEVQIGRAHV